MTVDQEVQWLLAEKLLHVRTGAVNPRVDVISRRSVALATFNSTLEALRYVNAISEEESIQWRNKMWRALGLDPPDVGEQGTMHLVYLGDGEPPKPEHINLVPQYPRMASGPSETIEAFGGSLRIEEVEYDDGVTLIRWHIETMPDVNAAFPDLAAALEEDIVGMDDWAAGHFRSKNYVALTRHDVPRLALDDDVATDYFEHRVSAKSRPGVEIAGITAFTPGTPSHADYLMIHWLGSSLKINLSC
jgi:hypothetical protein